MLQTFESCNTYLCPNLYAVGLYSRVLYDGMHDARDAAIVVTYDMS